jgi:hypothetical protein
MTRFYTLLLTLFFFLPLAACSDNYSNDATTRVAAEATADERPVLRLVFRWPGDDFASRQELETRSKIEALIVARGVGKILRTGSGMGWMDIWIAVADPDQAQKELEAVVAAVAPETKYAIDSGGTDNE